VSLHYAYQQFFFLRGDPRLLFSFV
jgi:hypothetical protein